MTEPVTRQYVLSTPYSQVRVLWGRKRGVSKVTLPVLTVHLSTAHDSSTPPRTTTQVRVRTLV